MILSTLFDSGLDTFEAPTTRPDWGVEDEWSPLRAVLLGDPSCLDVLPSNTVSAVALGNGHRPCTARALGQHQALRKALSAHGVLADVLPCRGDMPDLAFTRDAICMTPWGAVALKPALPHREAEVDAVIAHLAELGVPLAHRITTGTIEGGDVALVRPGLVAIGTSGDRTSKAGAEELKAFFKARGWDALIVGFDPLHLHLDTLFSMAAPRVALACTAVLDAAFLRRIRAEGIRIVPVTVDEVWGLGCNVLAVGHGRVLMADATPRVARALRAQGLAVTELDLSEFLAGGGGVHCLTMPLLRRRAG